MLLILSLIRRPRHLNFRRIIPNLRPAGKNPAGYHNKNQQESRYF